MTNRKKCLVRIRKSDFEFKLLSPFEERGLAVNLIDLWDFYGEVITAMHGRGGVSESSFLLFRCCVFNSKNRNYDFQLFSEVLNSVYETLPTIGDLMDFEYRGQNNKYMFVRASCRF